MGRMRWRLHSLLNGVFYYALHVRFVWLQELHVVFLFPPWPVCYILNCRMSPPRCSRATALKSRIIM